MALIFNFKKAFVPFLCPATATMSIPLLKENNRRLPTGSSGYTISRYLLPHQLFESRIHIPPFSYIALRQRFQFLVHLNKLHAPLRLSPDHDCQGKP
jgi:hypothetical protein